MLCRACEVRYPLGRVHLTRTECLAPGALLNVGLHELRLKDKNPQMRKGVLDLGAVSEQLVVVDAFISKSSATGRGWPLGMAATCPTDGGLSNLGCGVAAESPDPSRWHFGLLPVWPQAVCRPSRIEGRRALPRGFLPASCYRQSWWYHVDIL